MSICFVIQLPHDVVVVVTGGFVVVGALVVVVVDPHFVVPGGHDNDAAT